MALFAMNLREMCQRHSSAIAVSASILLEAMPMLLMSYRKINLLLLKAAQRGFVDRTYKNLSNVFFALIVEPNLWRFLQKGPLHLY